MRTEHTDRAIKAAGGASALARALGIKQAAVSQWHRIPAERVPDVAAATGIPRHELRPDLWEPPSGTIRHPVPESTSTLPAGEPDSVSHANDEAARRGDAPTVAPHRHAVPEAA